jgi:hypothetical protein
MMRAIIRQRCGTELPDSPARSGCGYLGGDYWFGGSGGGPRAVQGRRRVSYLVRVVGRGDLRRGPE